MPRVWCLAMEQDDIPVDDSAYAVSPMPQTLNLLDRVAYAWQNWLSSTSGATGHMACESGT